MAPSVTDATVTLDTPNEDRTLHSITVVCTINPDSDADMCEVMATANRQTIFIGNEYEYMILHVHMYVYKVYVYLLEHYSRT